MTNEKQQKIMERISNLMAKTVENGCTAEEAASAAAFSSAIESPRCRAISTYSKISNVSPT